MSAQTLVVFFGFGAAALALWTDFRFPRITPGRVWAIVVHLAVAVVLSRLMIVGLERLSDDGSQLATLWAVFGLALPSLVYLLLVGVWVIKFAQRALYRGTW